MILNGDTSGAITVTVPAVAGTNTVTIPASTGTVMVSGNMPAFSAYPNASQTLSNITYTKIQCNVKTSADNSSFDTNGYYDNVTNYRFTPLIAGYYQVNAAIAASATTIRVGQAVIYKNGSAFKTGEYAVTPTTNDAASCSAIVSTLIYLNGSTDYIEFYGWFQLLSGTLTTTANANQSYFQAVLVRGA
jgi:hypothetical protein